jgi:hypothetical protein
MNTHNIYPFIIIIFSVLIFFALINNERNKKFNNAFEKFINNKINFTPDLFYGFWTSLDTVVNSKGQASNLINITKDTLYFKNKEYKIDNIVNRLLITSIVDDTRLEIKMINSFSNLKEENTNQEDSSDSLDSDILVCIVLIRTPKGITDKFAIYKLDNNGYLDERAIPIIQNKSYIYKVPIPLYNFDNYMILGSNKYKYPDNFITFEFGKTDNNIFDKLNNKYNGILKFAIQRVYRSPLGGEITTFLSNNIDISAIKNLQIPTKIVVSPFDNDKTLNNITNFDDFSPKYTILYFYKITDTKSIFKYSKPNITIDKSVFKFKNNSDSMFKNNIEFNDLASSTKVLNNINSMVLVGKYTSNASSPTLINFSDLYSFL